MLLNNNNNNKNTGPRPLNPKSNFVASKTWVLILKTIISLVFSILDSLFQLDGLACWRTSALSLSLDSSNHEEILNPLEVLYPATNLNMQFVEKDSRDYFQLTVSTNFEGTCWLIQSQRYQQTKLFSTAFPCVQGKVILQF